MALTHMTPLFYLALFVGLVLASLNVLVPLLAGLATDLSLFLEVDLSLVLAVDLVSDFLESLAAAVGLPGKGLPLESHPLRRRH